MSEAALAEARPGGHASLGRSALPIVVVALAYFATARLGLSLASTAEQVTVVWPPTGLALAAVLLLGKRVAAGVWAAAFLVNLLADATPAGAFGIACGNTLEAVAGAALLRAVGFDPALRRVRDVAALVVLGALVSTVVSATLGMTSLALAGVHPWSSYFALWRLWWIGDAVGDLLVAPLVLTWARPAAVPWSRRRSWEAVAVLATVAAVSGAVFLSPLPQAYGVHHIAYAAFPPAMWAALRLGPRGSAVANVVIAASAIAGTLLGRGPFAMETEQERLFLPQLFMALLAVTALLASAAVAETSTAERRRRADYAVTRALAESRSLAEAAPRILDGICEHLGWDVGAIWRTGPGGDVLTCVEVRHRPDVHVPRFEAMTRETRFPMGRGLPGRVWQSGEPAWIEDVVGDTNFPRAPAAGAEGLHGAFGFPIRVGAEVTGVIEFFSREIRRPDEDLLRMFATVGVQIGQFIDRQRAEEDLREVAAAKDRFLATLGHELRNPMAAIRNALEVLRLREGTTHVPMLDVMERQLHHLTRLVDDLLDVARITRGHIELRREPVDLAPVVAEAVAGAAARAERQGQSITLSPPEAPVVVVADRLRLEQVVSNLLSNAIRYTPHGGRIEVALRVEGDEAVLQVRDDGIGIAPEMAERIFDLFVQAGRLPSRPPEGLGVGLTLVRSLVEMHGGTVRARSDGHGRGSEFTVRLPRAEPGALPFVPPAEAAAATATVGEAVRPLHVLVVDDNTDSAEMLATLLRVDGHRVDVAADGAEALRLAAQAAPHLVLLDIGLPGMDGYEVARRLRAEHDRAMTLVALTGFGQVEDRNRSAAAGFDLHLVKPVEPATLRKVLAGRPGPSS